MNILWGFFVFPYTYMNISDIKYRNILSVFRLISVKEITCKLLPLTLLSCIIKANLSYKKCKIVIKVRHTKTLTTYNVWYIGEEIQEIELTWIIFILTGCPHQRKGLLYSLCGHTE